MLDSIPLMKYKGKPSIEKGAESEDAEGVPRGWHRDLTAEIHTSGIADHTEVSGLVAYFPPEPGTLWADRCEFNYNGCELRSDVKQGKT